MSSFDIGSLVSSLQSTKIKQRNDALVQLESLLQSPLNLSPKSFRVLVFSILDLITIETKIYKTKNTIATENRLIAASSYVKLLVEKSLDSITLKSKLLIDIIRSIIALSFVDNEILIPCSVDFILTVDTILRLGYVKDHLNYTDYNSFANYFYKIINICTDSFENEKLLAGTFSALHNLLQCDLLMSTNYLQLYKVYEPILPILRKTCSHYSRDNIVILICFKIINKLIIVLSTEDIVYVNGLIQVGIDVMLALHSTNLSKLFNQFLVFVNLNPVYDYLTLSNSRVTQGLEDNQPHTIDDLDVSRLLYKLSSLSQSLIPKLNTADFELNLNDINLIEYNTEVKWFKLKSIGFASTNYKAWLLYLGLSKILSSYFNLKETLKLSRNSDFEFDSSSSILSKRQKLGIIGDSLHSANSILDFCNRLISENTDPKTQKTGLKVLVFYLQWYSTPPREPTVDHSNDDICEDMFSIKETLNFSFASYDNTTDDKSFLVKNVLATFDSSELTSWTMLVCESLLVDNLVFPKYIQHRSLYQLLSISLSSLKDSLLCSVSCKIARLVFILMERYSLYNLLDKPMITQIQNLIDLSDINGPCEINNQSIFLWYCLNEVIQKKNIKITQSVIAEKVQEWLLIKLQRGTMKFRACSKLPEFVAWLCGVQIFPSHSEITLQVPQEISICEPFDFLEERLRLESFIALDLPKPVSDLKFDICVNNLADNDSSEAFLFTVINLFSKKSFMDNSTTIEEFHANIMLVSLSRYVKLHSKFHHFSNSMEQQSTFYFESLINVTLSAQEKRDILCQFNSLFPTLQEEVKQIVLSHLPLKSFSIDLLRQFQTEQEGTVKQSSNMFSDENRSNLMEKETEVDVINWTYLNHSTEPLFEVLESMFNFNSITQMIPILVANLERTNLSRAVKCVAYLTNKLNGADLALVPTTLLNQLVRFIGVNILVNHKFERSEIVFTSVCKLLEALLPVFLTCEDEGFKKDCYDMCTWLVECDQQMVITSELASIESCKFIQKFMSLNDESFMSNEKLEPLFFDKVKSSSNFGRTAIAPETTEFIHKLQRNKQTEFYSKLLTTIPSPKISVEASASFSYFFTKISESSSHILQLALFNILECSKFSNFVSYLKPALDNICENLKIESRQLLFKGIKVTLLKWWWDNDSQLMFPFELFDYPNKEIFCHENYRELVAIVMSSTNNHRNGNDLIEELAELKQSDVRGICNDSLSLAIPLAFAHHGKKSDIFTELAVYLGGTHKQDFQEKLLLVVLDIIQFTDMSRDDVARELFKSGPIALQLFSPKASDSQDLSSHLIISPGTCKELLTKLVKKYSVTDNFWSLDTIYFLIRRLLLRLKQGTLFAQRAFYMKQLKMTLVLGSNFINNSQILEILIQGLCPIYHHSDINEDIQLIFTVLGIDKFSELSLKRSLPLVFEILDAISRATSVYQNSIVLEKLALYLENVDTTSTVYPILMTSISKLRGFPHSCTLAEIECFLQDSNLMNNWESCKNSEIALSVVSNIFPNVTEHSSAAPNANVVKLLINARSFENYSRGFQLWASKYIANFYLSGEFFSENCKIASFEEVGGINPEHFEARIKYMDHFLDTMIQYCEEGDSTAGAIAESIIGVLIYNYNESRAEILKYINFKNYYDKFEKYIIPISLKSCLLLNDVVELESIDESLGEILNDFNEFILDKSFESWTTGLLLAFLDKVASTTKISRLISIFAIKVSSFACKIIPWFISYFVQFSKGKFNTSIAELISNLLNVELKDRNLIELLTKIVLLIRTGQKKGIVYFDDLMESIDLRKVVEVVSAQKLSKTALLLFEELHGDDYSLLDWQSERKLLSEIYDSIDDEDIIHGIPEKATVDYAISMMNGGIDNFNQLKFSSALFDAEISLDSAQPNTNILPSLSSNGLKGISRLLGQTIGATSDDNAFEWAWKLNRWDLPIPQKCNSEHQTIYKVLKQIHDFPTKSMDVLQDSILSTICSQVQSSTNISSCKEQSDNLTGWFKSLSMLHSIGEVLSYDDSTFPHQLNEFANSTSWFETSDLSNSGSIMQARQVMFQVLSEFPKDKSRICNQNIWLGALHELMRYNMACRNSNQSQGMISSSMLLTEICKQKFQSNEIIAKETDMLSQYQVATSIWSQGITDLPVVMLKDLAMKGGVSLPIDNLSVDTNLINATLVGWIASSRQDLASNIMEKYVIPTANTADGINNAKQSAKVYHLLANFCEKQYKSKSLSDDIDKLEKRVSSKKSEIDDLKSHYGKTSVTAEEKKQVQRFYSKLKAQYNSEVLDLQSSKENKEMFSKKAVEFYLKAISLSEDDDEDEDVDKFFALWLELSADNDLNIKLKRMILDLPSYKLISWSTQLISRLAGEQSEFQDILQKLILKMCADHPYHTLYQLLSLKFHKDYSDGNSDEYKTAKYDAANKLWTKLLNGTNPRTEGLIVPVERFCHEAYKLSEHKVPRGKSIQLSRLNVAHFWLEELPAIPPPTMTMSVDRSTSYENVVVIAKVESKVTIATSGLSLPKILTFHLSNGKEHRMLVKYGADDLRQDSIMEQVFEKVNQMLKKNKETRKRNLRIRTYKAVPMSPKSGMIEFVANSISLIDVIKPYHTRQDSMTLEKARQMMRECQSGEKQQRYQVYQEITAEVKPVLRHFYFDNFLTPDSWFDSRIAYTHGIATTSIVGHILGLGDRHCNNILLDKETGEPIHIDLGVAFDQGKRLPIPETVPFRLTRDIVDGFGVNGTNGIFSKSCQRTFEVLRRNSDHILSILDVLRWDPLYSWTISTMRKRRLQDETGGLGNIAEDGSEAGRAVVTVSDKLDAGGLSVEATVTELIQEATNPHNLALIYLGWCPFY